MNQEFSRLGLSRPVLTAGTRIERAAAAVLLLHGRGASARDILQSLPQDPPADFAYLAPEAKGRQWYPKPFNAPLKENEPRLSSSLALLSELISYVGQAGLGPRRVILYGFSQGACLALEYAARNAQRYGAVIGLSGGLIGPDDLDRQEEGPLDGTPVFLGCSDPDPYIERHRVEHAANVLGRMGGEVTVRLYPHMGHTINEDEMQTTRKLMEALRGGAATS